MDAIALRVHIMPPDAVAETVAFLEALSRRAAELAAALPALDLGAEDLAALAGEVQRVNARLADAEERLAWVGPAERRGEPWTARNAGWFAG
jgi:hypothetical protein